MQAGYIRRVTGAVCIGVSGHRAPIFLIAPPTVIKKNKFSLSLLVT